MILTEHERQLATYSPACQPQPLAKVHVVLPRRVAVVSGLDDVALGCYLAVGLVVAAMVVVAAADPVVGTLQQVQFAAIMWNILLELGFPVSSCLVSILVCECLCSKVYH